MQDSVASISLIYDISASYMYSVLLIAPIMWVTCGSLVITFEQSFLSIIPIATQEVSLVQQNLGVGTRLGEQTFICLFHVNCKYFQVNPNKRQT